MNHFRKLWFVTLFTTVLLFVAFSKVQVAINRPSADVLHSHDPMTSTHLQEQEEEAPDDETLDGPCLGYLATESEGRLGNQMGEYATLYANSKRLGVPALISNKMVSFLSSLFPHLSLPTVSSRSSCQPELFQMLHKDAVNAAQTKEELFAKVELPNINTTGYPMEIQIFHKYRSELVKEFRFADDILAKVQSFYALLKRRWQTKGVEPVFVGMHIRRTDYKEHMQRLWKGKITSRRFFADAMDIFRTRLQQSSYKPVFVIATDDLLWAKRMFIDEPDVEFVSMSAPIESRGIEAEDKFAFDFTTLANANHSIISLGTFGFWSAYLAGGEVIMAKGNSVIKHDLVRKVEETPGFSNWTLLNDACYKEGRLTQECKWNRRMSGVS